MSEDTTKDKTQEQPEENQQAEASEDTQQVQVESKGSDSVELNGLYAFKVGMSSVYDEEGTNIPVTVLKYEPWFVSQVKTADKDGYFAVQVACGSRKADRTSGAMKGHLDKTPFEHGAKYLREIRQELPEGVAVGQKVSLESLKKGDRIKVSSRSKGRGFSGAMKRHGFGGGPASHGSGFHRRPGSIGNCEFPGRVMPGRKMPGQYGNTKVTVSKVEVIDVLPEQSVVMVKGPVPGSRNSLVQLMKV